MTTDTQEGVDPSWVPRRALASGATMPAVGMGTFGSDEYTSDRIAAAVRGGAAGYRHFDCASLYSNEAQIGEALRDVREMGIARDDLWVTSKVWYDSHGPGRVIASCECSLRDLGLDHLDLFLIHWPFPNYHAPGFGADARDPNARPYSHDAYMDAWGQMADLLGRGLVRHIGKSNMTVPKLRLLRRDARVRPAPTRWNGTPTSSSPSCSGSWWRACIAIRSRRLSREEMFSAESRDTTFRRLNAPAERR